MPVTAAIIPIALAILAGWAARRSGLVPDEAWPGVETLSFRLLIPAILIHAISGADLSPSRMGPLVFALVATLIVLGILAFVARLLIPRESLGNPAMSTLFQVTTRWNAFVSLAAADLIGGADGVLLVAVAMAVLVPLINVANIVTVAALVSADTSWRRILRTLVTNPIIIACAIGLVSNLTIGGLPETIGASVELVGRAAIGIGLLAIGAGIEIDRLLRISIRVVAGILIRPLLAPAVFLAIGIPVGLNTAQLTAGILFTAVPAATNGYFIARAMGGDAELYAELVAWQTLATLFALPFYLAVVASL